MAGRDQLQGSAQDKVRVDLAVACEAVRTTAAHRGVAGIACVADNPMAGIRAEGEAGRMADGSEADRDGPRAAREGLQWSWKHLMLVEKTRAVRMKALQKTKVNISNTAICDRRMTFRVRLTDSRRVRLGWRQRWTWTCERRARTLRERGRRGRTGAGARFNSFADFRLRLSYADRCCQ